MNDFRQISRSISSPANENRPASWLKDLNLADLKGFKITRHLSIRFSIDHWGSSDPGLRAATATADAGGSL